MFPLLPPPPLSPSFFFRARWRIMALKPKESMWSRRSEEGESMSEPSISRLPLFLLFIRPFIYPPSLYNPRPLSHSRSSLVFKCIILTCHFRVYDVLIYCQVAPAHPCRCWNKSQWSGGDETAGCVFFFVCIFLSRECLCVCCHGTLIMLPPLKMGSCAPFWQCCAGPGAWLCAMLMVSLRARRKTRVRGNEG